jgi:hypothetical protein
MDVMLSILMVYGKCNDLTTCCDKLVNFLYKMKLIYTYLII